jgi:hypothetical protein
MNDDIKREARARAEAALKATQAQTEEVAAKIGSLLRAGAERLKTAIQNDISNRR